jgi:hypothetical protein
MEPYHTREGKQEKLPMPELLDDEEEYEVEAVVDKTRSRGEVWYKVTWKGWPEEYDQWIPENEMANSKKLVKQYESEVIARSQAKRKRRGTKK